MHSVTSNAVAEGIRNTINQVNKGAPFIGDNQTIDVLLENGLTYIYFNTHVYAVEFILFSFFNNQILQLHRLTGNQVTSITAIGNQTVRFTANGNCRGFLFKIGTSYGT